EPVRAGRPKVLLLEPGPAPRRRGRGPHRRDDDGRDEREVRRHRVRQRPRRRVRARREQLPLPDRRSTRSMTTPTPQPFTGPVGVGFIGAGVISDQYLTNLTAFPDVKVLILGDLDTERAASQAEKY